MKIKLSIRDAVWMGYLLLLFSSTHIERELPLFLATTLFTAVTILVTREIK